MEPPEPEFPIEQQGSGEPLDQIGQCPTPKDPFPEYVDLLSIMKSLWYMNHNSHPW